MIWRQAEKEDTHAVKTVDDRIDRYDRLVWCYGPNAVLSRSIHILGHVIKPIAKPFNKNKFDYELFKTSHTSL